ncbi:DUF2550 family protein [Georgenia sp. SUBG003]|uniref:DUF2550 family protein n=1 Tax=Georgenia sp. SUBG003 TaxID=1497974 RepID=UPI003AB54504
MVLALVAVLLLALFAVRVRRLAHRIGSFECALRPPGRRDWTSGIAVFGVGRVDWYRLVSLSLRPDRTFARADLEVRERVHRSPDGKGQVTEIRCGQPGKEVDLAMRRDSLAGLVSWLESAPPRGDYFV